MTKTKSVSPKKGKPAGTASARSSADPPLRRSSRNATPSAKRVEADSVSPPKVTKRASPAKKSASPKKPAAATKTKVSANSQAELPAKFTGPIRRTRSPSKETPVPKAGNDKDFLSPKRRGRPKKCNSREVPGLKSGKAKVATASTRTTRSRSSAPSNDSQLQSTEEDWADSPKKKMPPKWTSKSADTDRKSSLDVQSDDGVSQARMHQAGVGGVRKSIETSPSRKRDRTPSGAVSVTSQSQSRGKSRSKSPAKPRGRSNSIRPFEGSRATATEEPSTSPAKGRATSISRGATKTAGPHVTGQALENATRNLRNSRSRSASPGKAVAKVTTGLAFTPPPSRAKARPATASRSHMRSPKPSAFGNTITVSKTRPSRSPSKSPAKSRSRSPAKAIGRNKARPRSQSPGRSSVRNASESPRQASRSPSRASDTTDGDFEGFFTDQGDYGKALRRIESQSYNSTKRGSALKHLDFDVKAHHAQGASMRGVQRAQLELGLRTIADNREQRGRDGYDKRNVDFSQNKRPSSGRRPSFYDEHESKAKDHLPDVDQIESEVGGDHQDQPAAGRNSKKRAASEPSEPPKKKASRSQSPSKRTTDTSAPLGNRSSFGRGTIESVTNPKFIPQTKGTKKNPFYGTLPLAPIWHRRMPPYFPFGETPFMEKQMSRQISEDLARGNEEIRQAQKPGLVSQVTNYASNAVNSALDAVTRPFSGSDSVAAKRSQSPWDLPEVTDAEVKDAVKQTKKRSGAATGGTSHQKRKASEAEGNRSPKRTRRPSYMMSGAL